MERSNVWELVKKEAEFIIWAIEKGEVKMRKDYNEYLDSLYNWKITNAIESIVSLYLEVNNIDIPWDNETEDKAE